MMLKLLISFCLVAVAVSQWTECGDMQRLKVKKQWTDAFGFTDEREVLNDELWTNILKRQPEAAERYFSRVRGDNVYSPEFRSHAARVIGGFDMTLSMIDEPATFAAQIAHLNAQHIVLDVDGIYFKVFREELLAAVQRRVGRCFDQDAWDVCVKVITDGIKHNEK